MTDYNRKKVPKALETQRFARKKKTPKWMSSLFALFLKEIIAWRDSKPVKKPVKWGLLLRYTSAVLSFQRKIRIYHPYNFFNAIKSSFS